MTSPKNAGKSRAHRAILLALISIAILLVSIPSATAGDLLPLCRHKRAVKATSATCNSEHKCGFVDAQGNWVVPPKYDDVGEFSRNLAPVKIEGKWGYIDVSGHERIPPQFASAFPFTGDLARTSIGWIDSTGARRLPEMDAWAEEFGEDKLAFARGGKWGYMNSSGSAIIEPQYLFATAFRNGRAHVVVRDGQGLERWGLISPSGSWLLKPAYESLSFSDDGSGVARLPGGREHLIGLSGERIGAAEFDRIGVLSEGRRSAFVGKSNAYKCGYIDSHGNIIAPIENYNCNPFREGLALVYALEGSLPQYIDQMGIVRIRGGGSFAHGKDFHGGRAVVIGHDGKFGAIRADGSNAVPIIYDGAANAFRADGLLAVAKDCQHGYVDRDGQIVTMGQPLE